MKIFIFYPILASVSIKAHKQFFRGVIVVIFILRFILIFWIISIIARWFRRFNLPGKNSDEVTGERKKTDSSIDINYTGKIDDADFEEIDSE